MRFYGFMGVEFLFKAFKARPLKSLAPSFDGHTLTLNVGQKITNIQSTYHILMLLSCILFRSYYSIYWFL